MGTMQGKKEKKNTSLACCRVGPNDGHSRLNNPQMKAQCDARRIQVLILKLKFKKEKIFLSTSKMIGSF
jgi:hypothetical protein